jgi:hypothetical protein
MEYLSDILENIKYDFKDWSDYTLYKAEGGCGRRATKKKRNRCRAKKRHEKLAKRKGVPQDLNNRQAHNVLLRHRDLRKAFDADKDLAKAIDKTKSHWKSRGMKEGRDYSQWFFDKDSAEVTNARDKKAEANEANDDKKAMLAANEENLLSTQAMVDNTAKLNNKLDYQNNRPRRMGFQNLNEGFDTHVDKTNVNDYNTALKNDLNKCSTTFSNRDSSTILSDTYKGALTSDYATLTENDDNSLSYGPDGDADFEKCITVCNKMKGVPGNSIDNGAIADGNFCINVLNQNQLYLQAGIDQIDSNLGVVSMLHTNVLSNTFDISNSAQDYKERSLREDKMRFTEIDQQSDNIESILMKDGEQNLVFDKNNDNYKDQTKLFEYFNSNFLIHIYLFLLVVYAIMLFVYDNTYKMKNKMMFVTVLLIFPFAAFLIEKYSFILIEKAYKYVFRYVYVEKDY